MFIQLLDDKVDSAKRRNGLTFSYFDTGICCNTNLGENTLAVELYLLKFYSFFFNRHMRILGRICAVAGINPVVSPVSADQASARAKVGCCSGKNKVEG